MADWTLSENAASDLLDIAIFTGGNWGTAQSDAYLEAIYDAIYRIADYPEAGARRDMLSPDVRVLPVRRHRLYYSVEPDRVLILRVLHAARDEASELGLGD